MLIYLDNAATCPMSPEVIEYLGELNTNNFGNPSSIHSIGRKSKKLLNETRELIANKINAEANEIFFLSGATEANNTVFQIADFDLIITSPSEHPAVIEPAKATGKTVIWLNLDKEGFIDFAELEKHLEKAKFEHKKVLVSIMHGNNEIGTIQDIERIGKLCKLHHASFHSDCVQTFCKVAIDVKKFNLDYLTVSAHKIHGPKGVGFLYKSNNSKNNGSDPLIIGGGQELDFRSGTENVNSIAAMGKAIESLDEKSIEYIKELQKLMIHELLKIDGLIINGPIKLEQRVPGNVNISLSKSKLNSEQMVLRLDLLGLCASSGSACSSNKGDAEAQIVSSYVLRACHSPEELANKAIRLSISKLNTREEVIKTIEFIKQIAA